MNLENTTKLAAGYTTSLDKTGREWMVVIAKGTFGIPDRPDHEPRLLDEQVPLVLTDVFTGEPGFSAPLYEIDYAPPKPRCDVLLNGSCYAPGGKPATKVQVTLRVGALTKSFNVVGKRMWKSSVLAMTPSSPEPFKVMPISYNNAFGGVDKPSEDQKTHQWYLLNHAGVGYHPRTAARALDGKAVPNTEELNNPISRPDGSYKPMAFGSLGRAWQQRVKWAGTYDKKWLDEKYPFLPDDFDERYFQAAPEDQQVDHPVGGDQVELLNLTPAGRTTFRLPVMSVPVEFFHRNGESKRLSGTVDTIMLEPDLNRFQMSWRCALPIRRNLREFLVIRVGQHPVVRSPEPGVKPQRVKPHYRSLADAASVKRPTSRK